jgi:hypothetical protein
MAKLEARVPPQRKRKSRTFSELNMLLSAPAGAGNGSAPAISGPDQVDEARNLTIRKTGPGLVKAISRQISAARSALRKQLTLRRFAL